MKYGTKFAALVAAASLGIASAAFAQSTFTGTSSAAFGTPISNSTDNDFSGVGTNTFTNGANAQGDPNIFVVDGVPFSAAADSPFVVGNLTYTNGSTYTGNITVPVGVTLAFTAPSTLSKTFTFDLSLDITPDNTGNPVLDGDTLTPLNVESSTTFDAHGQTYTLRLLGFSNDGGTTLASNFELPEGATVTSQLYGEIALPTLTPPTHAVPLPPAAYAGAAGLLGVGALRRRRTA